ncbi:MAG: PTS galactitol transporter subunit IIB [Atopobiaceae bacterium]|jgi:PTS system galactitol-specific IIB component|nr:PTS galactitol transporter subunit IIB [Atopobiaceae bacterium]MCH4181313.1 PTS galactitol transporter subunit IIB [Atopobiaceae bacterium]MCH4215072.1 PTS galactitol transporter subunit IIB [Atopobiaceae bacterium]MCH4230368.1 PTS galactitol transporter subunit IIB [Atopobiaceae bacterium]MCH4276777.1 PTS galactitol transporter subunit IIB [Atopobiaceae bacterium]
MRKIVVACGTGIACSTAIAARISDLLDEAGYAGDYQLVQCPVNKAPAECADADLLVATVVRPDDVSCDYVCGVPLLTGEGRAEARAHILGVMGGPDGRKGPSPEA